MRKSYARTIVLLLVLALTTGCLPLIAAGEERPNLTFVISVDEILDYNDEVGQLIQDKFNVTLIAKPNESEEALGLWAAGDELPHMWTSSTFEDPYRFYNWIDQGIIRDVPYELISKYPNVKRIVDESKELNGIKDLKEDKYWYVPRKQDANHDFFVADGARIFYREDWARDLGLEIPETMDEYYAFLQAIGQSGVEGAPTIGVLASQGLLYYFAMTGIDPESWVKEDDQWIPGYMSERMLEPLKSLRALYDNQTIDNEYLITETSSLLSKWGMGLGATVIRNGGDAYWYNRMHRHVAESIDPDYTTKPYKALDMVEVMPIPTAADGNKYWLPAIDSNGVEFSSKVTDEELDRLLEILDWTLTDEAMDLYRYGMEGITYEVNEDGKYVLLNDPATGVPYQLRFPSSGLVTACNWMFAEDFYNDKRVPSESDDQEMIDGSAKLKEQVLFWTMEYNEHVLEEGDAFTARLISSPAKDDIYAGFEWSDEINAIVVGTEDVEAMFESFKAYCIQKGMQQAIDEVTAIMDEAGY